MPIGGIVAGVGAIGGSLIGASSAKKSAKQMAAGQEAARREHEAALADIRTQLSPYLSLGQSVLPQLTGMIEGGPNTPAMLEALTKYPGYQFALEQGRRQLNADAGKAGSRWSGRQIEGGIKYGQDMATGLFDKYFGNLMQLAGIGQNATNLYSGSRTNLSGMIGGAHVGQANAQASGTSAVGNIWGNLFQNTLPGLAGMAAGSNPGSWLNSSVGGWFSSPSYAGKGVG